MHLEVDTVIAAPTPHVWKILSDFGGIHRFNPNLKHSQLLPGSPTCGLGAERQCDLKNGRDFIRERIVAWEEGRGYTVDIYDGTMPLERAQARLRLERSGEETRASMTLDYQPKFGALGVVMDWLLLRHMMRRMARRLLAGLAAEAQRPAIDLLRSAPATGAAR